MAADVVAVLEADRAFCHTVRWEKLEEGSLSRCNFLPRILVAETDEQREC